MLQMAKTSGLLACFLLFVVFHTARTDIAITIPIPSPPSDVRLYYNNSRTATVVWTAASNSVLYSLEVLKTLSSEDDVKWRRVIITDRTRAILTRLEPLTDYVLYIHTVSNFGLSPKVRTNFTTPAADDELLHPKPSPIMPRRFTFLPDIFKPKLFPTSTVPPKVNKELPVDINPDSEFNSPEITVKHITTSAITLEIIQSPAFQRNKRYILVHKILSNYGRAVRHPLLVNSKSSHEHVIKNLRPSTTYVIWIEVSGDGSDISRTLPIHVKTLKHEVTTEDDYNCDKTCRECVTCSIVDPLMQDPANVHLIKSVFGGFEPDLPAKRTSHSAESEEEDFM